MYFFYVDESGDTGMAGSRSFVLACVGVPATSWDHVLGELTSFRRWIKANFGVPLREELKANFLLRGGGAWRSVSPPARMRIFEQAMRLQEKLAVTRTFAVVIDKARYVPTISAPATDIHELAWSTLYERLERFTSIESVNGMVLHDEGQGDTIRKLHRRFRRFNIVPSHFGGPGLARPANLLIEDPVSRRSHESYFIQLADLNAFAAFRAVFPATSFSSHYWDLLGFARVASVTRFRRGPIGIVVR